MPRLMAARSKVISIAGGAALLLGGLAFIVLAPARGSSTARLIPQLKEAIIAQETSTSLPPGFEIGHASSAARSTLHSKIIVTFEKYTAGSQLTRDINATLAWADRMATQDGGSGYVKSFQLDAFTTDPPIIAGQVATVSGSYTMTETIVDGLPNGTSSDRTGVWSFQFVAQLQDSDGRWRITDISRQETDFRGLEPTGGPRGTPVEGPPKPSQDLQGQPILPQHQPIQP